MYVNSICSYIVQKSIYKLIGVTQTADQVAFHEVIIYMILVSHMQTLLIRNIIRKTPKHINSKLYFQKRSFGGKLENIILLNFTF